MRPTTDERPVITHHASRITHHAPLVGLVILALGLRLLVWRWRAPYPLGGDEREYFNQALMLLREHRYVELKLMRPPLYTGFLAACIYVFDSLVQRLRLIQEIISALTVVPIYALTRRLFGDRRIALVAGLLAATNYTLAANATELLTETLFLFGLTVSFWLLLKAGDRLRYAALAGLTLGALTLLRSVALPLLPLGAIWLLLRRRTTDPSTSPPTEVHLRAGDGRRTTMGTTATERPPYRDRRLSAVGRWSVAACFLLCAGLVILPWTIRNDATYGAPILVDTTGAENLWLDNDPAGREAVKRQLYDLGDDRAARQQIAFARGAAAIAGDPGRFAVKAWGEAQKFFALQYFDDLRDRRAIWVPPLEVWLRLLLGDGLWLVVLLGGVAGISLMTNAERRTTNDGGRRRDAPQESLVVGRWSLVVGPRWLFVPWALYTLLTALVFHVELRYRLPLYPALLPYAAWALTRIADGRWQITDWERMRSNIQHPTSNIVLAVLACGILVGLTLLHRPYIGETWMLGWKHARLWQAGRALARGDAVGARSAAWTALGWDADSALARVALARAALLDGDQRAALDALDAAIGALRAHPHAHLVRGAILRAQGDQQEARDELAFERNSLEDLQDWAWQAFAPVAPAPAAVDIGGGLDLGFVRGFALPEESSAFRWSGAASQVMLTVPPGATRLDLRLASGRPPGAPPAIVVVSADGRELQRIRLEDGWRTYSLPLSHSPGPLILTLSGDTFRPRDYDRASPDDRALGVMVNRVLISP